MSSPLTVACIVPAFNEELGLHDTLRSLLAQTHPPEQIIVVDDCSTDTTPHVLELYPVIVLRPPANLGSKAKAQNYALPYCQADLVLPVDADTVLAPDYLERIKEPFANPDVTVAAGNVQTKVTSTITERGRQIEYLFGFQYYRVIQNKANAPVVCSGCCSAFRRSDLLEFGGFPERTIVEDFDYAWSQQIAGKRAIYVAGAEAWAADPESPKYLKKQMHRWMAGFFQNMRIHFFAAVRHKPMLALWGGLAIWEILTAPLWWLFPVLAPVFLHMPFTTGLAWFWGIEVVVTVPVIVYAAIRRKQPVIRTLLNIPFTYFNKAINGYYAWKNMIIELVLVPMGRAKGLSTYEKGR